VSPCSPCASSTPWFRQTTICKLPGIKGEEVGKLAPHARDLEDFVYAFQEKVDGRIGEVKKAVETWGRIELVDAVFKGMS